jgi:putative hydrolase of the HAD superfamily
VAIKTIVLDFGNVVAFFDHRLTTNRLAPYAGVSADELHALLFTGEMARDYERGQISTIDFSRWVRDVTRLTCSDEFFERAWADVFWPNDDVINRLPALKNTRRLLLASNTNELHTRQFTRQFERALAHFDRLIFSHEIRARKPESVFYKRCEQFAGCQPEECLFIDDLPANVSGAHACGWNAVVFRGMPDLQIRLAELGIRGVG